MGGEIVKLVERYQGAVSDSYVLALQALENPEKRIIVESAVHFMAETVAILSHPHQEVWITNPKAGCTMEMLAKDHLVEPIADQLAGALRRRPALRRVHEHQRASQGTRWPDGRRSLHQLERTPRRRVGQGAGEEALLRPRSAPRPQRGRPPGHGPVEAPRASEPPGRTAPTTPSPTSTAAWRPSTQPR